MEALGDIAPNAPVPPAADKGEAALWHELRTNDSAEARQKLFDLHYGYARQLAAKHFLDRKSGDIEFSDLSQMACTGLLEAIERYDPGQGASFRTYARRRISGNILDGLNRMSEMREQMSFKRRARRERLKSLAIEDPEKLGAADALMALIEMATGLAVGFMLEDGGLYARQDTADHRASPYDSLAWKEMTRSLRAEISSLPGQAAQVIRYHYLDGLSFEQIARTLSLSKGRVSQIHRSALNALRERISPAGAFNLEK